MGCCGDDREKGPTNQTQRWDFITLSDFKATSAWTSIAYGWLWFMAIVAVAVYALDTFTAVNLLAFNKWSSSVQPKIPFEYSKWIFTGCILLSWALAFYEWYRAIRTIKRGGVAQSFLDPLAVSLQSMRPQGWRRFLVFTELTKSKKGADYIVLFVYFSFKGAIRVILAEGPRQAINGMTLYAVMDASLIVHGQTDNNNSSIQQFFANLSTLADENLQQTLVYCSMLFTLVIWVFSALSLAVAGVLYLCFVWHYIPQRDGRLRTYCKRKVDRRLEKIVEHKIKAALEDEEKERQKAEKKAELKRQKTGELGPTVPKLARQPTLPQFGEEPDIDDEKSEISPGGDRPGMPGRTNTNASGYSTTSYASNAPLLSNAGFGGGQDVPLPPVPAQTFWQQPALPPIRPMTAQSQRSMTSQGPYTPTSQQQRPFTPTIQSQPRSYSPAPSMGSRPTYGQSMRGPYFDNEPTSATSTIPPGNGLASRGPPLSRIDTQNSQRGPPLSRMDTQNSQASSFSRPGGPALPQQMYDSTQRRYSPPRVPSTQPGSYEMIARPTNGNISADSPSSYRAFQPAQPALGPRNEPFLRSNTAPPARNNDQGGYTDILDSYGNDSRDNRSPSSATQPIPSSNMGSTWMTPTLPTPNLSFSRPGLPQGPIRSNTAGPASGSGVPRSYTAFRP